MENEKIMNLAKQLGELALKNNIVIATAESCTAGFLSGSIANIAGSSQWLDAGYIVYTPEAKNRMLGVRFETIDKFNITSKAVAQEMAKGAMEKSININDSSKSVNFSMGVTGVAGPGGGTDEIPVGTVCMAWCYKKGDSVLEYSERIIFHGNRNEIRWAVVEHMLQRSINLLTN